MSEIDDEETREAVVMKVASGASIRETAREFMTTENEVRTVIREEARRAAGGEAMRETWFLESKRLQAAGLKCYNRGMAGDGDITALGVYSKLVERHAILAGANAPATHVLNVTTATAPIHQSSTEYYKQVLDSLQNYSPREQELEDKDWNREPMTDAEAEELDRFREEREARRRTEHDARREQRRLAHAKGGAPGEEG
jgi:hypothetical protein